MSSQNSEQTSEAKPGSVAPILVGASEDKKSKSFKYAAAIIPAFAALSSIAACASSYFAYVNQDSAYKAIILTSQIDAASSAIADGQRLTIVLRDLANFSDDLLPLQDSWLSIQSGRTKVSETEFASLKDKMQFISSQIQQNLTDFNELGKRLHQNVVKMSLVFPNEIWRDFNNALTINGDLLNNNALLLKNTRHMADSLIRQDAASMRDAQAQIIESREAIRKSRERISQMENSINFVSAKVASYLSAQRFARRPS